ncbi:MAG TPA: choice-of-anchor tandem repeat GloVer-containing protein [Terriglobales bacterium]|nr:choice-of-anchor tandem repeat GloVer-containing protein [Terriglobales bacterium]
MASKHTGHRAGVILAAIVLFTLLATQNVIAQTLQALHVFTGGSDGAKPWAGLTMDHAGNLYGTASQGGVDDGNVFKLTKSGSGWTFATIYSFQGDTDGSYPKAQVTFGPDGNLYGTTYAGGITDDCCGTVYKLTYSCRSVVCTWSESVLYRFQGGSDGSAPVGGIVFDSAGNIYGTTSTGGAGGCGTQGCGTVFKLTPSGGGWSESVLYRFTGGQDGGAPLATVTLDQGGNLYGAASSGGRNGFGVVFELSPSGSGWSQNVLYTFQNGNDGATPAASLIFDGAGNLYGTTFHGAPGRNGAVYELVRSGGGWTINVLYVFPSGTLFGPWASLLMDGPGNLYGTTYYGGRYHDGSVFKLTHSSGGWTERDVYSFEIYDGEIVYGNVVLDSNGVIYGTTYVGGSRANYGEVFEITQ